MHDLDVKVRDKFVESVLSLNFTQVSEIAPQLLWPLPLPVESTWQS